MHVYALLAAQQFHQQKCPLLSRRVHEDRWQMEMLVYWTFTMSLGQFSAERLNQRTSYA